MNRVRFAAFRVQWLKHRAGALYLTLGLACICSVPNIASAQWSGGPTGTIYYNGGNVGIGTANPWSRLMIVGTGDQWITVSNSVTTAFFGNEGNNTKIVSSGGAGIALRTDGGGWTDKVFVTNAGNVGIGTLNPPYRLSVEGTIGAREVIVTNTVWSDYVFRPGYRLWPLSEVRAYINAHHHLPDIPSEAEVKEKGVSVGEMQSKLLAKIEELTLHMITADERNTRLEQQNQELRDRLARLEKAASGATR